MPESHPHIFTKNGFSQSIDHHLKQRIRRIRQARVQEEGTSLGQLLDSLVIRSLVEDQVRLYTEIDVDVDVCSSGGSDSRASDSEHE